MKRMRDSLDGVFRHVKGLAGGLLLLCPWPALAANAAATEAAPDLTELPIEQLLDVQVTSVAKRPSRLYDSAAAVYVVTQEEIRRTGAQTIAEALRYVPGLAVNRADRNKWAISSRGFNDTFANKLLVLMDGRTVYTPIFSGVWWASQDMVIDDIDRIEVIRGPGASLWGSNAVNGVINIITKQAKATKGGLLSVSTGTQESGTVALRYGGQLGRDTDYRVYGKYFDRDAYVDHAGRDADDDWRAGRGGFRIDSRPTMDDAVTLQGDVYKSDDGGAAFTTFTPAPVLVSGDQKNHGANLLSRWKHQLSDTSDFQVQAYYDYLERTSLSIGSRYTVHTADMDLQHAFSLGGSHRIVWGGGYRLLSYDVANSASIALNPSERTDHLFSLFVQDEISLIPDTLKLTLGSRLEHKTRIGFQVQPNGRLLWTPDERNSLWLAVSRAVRMPSWVEQSVNFHLASPQPPLVASLRGTPNLAPEELLAYELGYRTELNGRLSVDMALFYNQYRRLIVSENADCRRLEFAGAFVECPLPFGNGEKGEGYGAELSALWQVTDIWRLRAGYTYTRVDTRPTGPGASIGKGEGTYPQQQVFVHSSLDLPLNTQFDLMFRHVDSMPGWGVSDFTTLDARLAWRAARDIELAVIGRNLTDDRHFEFGANPGLQPTQIQRDFLATVRWSF